MEVLGFTLFLAASAWTLYTNHVGKKRTSNLEKDRQWLLADMLDQTLYESDRISAHEWRELSSKEKNYMNLKEDFSLRTEVCDKCGMIHRFYVGSQIDSTREGFFFGGIKVVNRGCFAERLLPSLDAESA